MDKYYYLYWRHKEKKRRGDYYGAYNDFWSARKIVDSLKNKETISAAISHVSFLENLNIDKKLKIQNQRRFIVMNLLLCIVLSLLLCVFSLLSSKKKQKEAEEQERINMVIDSLKGQIDEMDKSFEKIKKGKDVTNGARAKFVFLRDLYEEVYIRTDNANDAESYLREAISNRIGDLRSNPQAREKFRRLVDKEMDGLMTKFQKDFPELSDDEYSLASYYFAGFDNTAVTIITNTSSVENTRIKKHRLKMKILNSSVNHKELYSTLL